MRVAFVYDRVNKIGGAERVLTALHELWPDAPLFTAVYYPKRAGWAKVFTVKTTFLQHIPFAKNHHEWFAWLTPFAFGALSFDGYDVVISITSAEAKSIVTKPETLHISYCLTPTRYLWSGVTAYTERTGFGMFHSFAKRIFTLLLPVLRDWDISGSSCPDHYVAISECVNKRIQKYYKRTADVVIYPPVDIDMFLPAGNKNSKGDYYLVVSRLVSYKRIDIVVRACSELNRHLIVIGDGSEKKQLRRIAGPTVEFIDSNLTDHALVGYYQQCCAFLFAGQEDFGIVAVEAQACGKPVIAYAQGGMAEIVIDGVTGLLFHNQSTESLKEAIIKFEKREWSTDKIRNNAKRFGKQIFQNAMLRFVKKKFSETSSFL